MKYVIDGRKEFDGSVKTLLNDDGIGMYSGKTEAEYIAEGCKIISEDELNELYLKWEDGLCGKWAEITEDEFDEALNVLPPVRWGNGGFFMSERYSGNVTGYYQKYNGKYYTSLQRLSSRKEDIIEELKKYIAA